jgi:hypothetical protein
LTLSISKVAAADEVDVYLNAMNKLPPIALSKVCAPELVHELHEPVFVSSVGDNCVHVPSEFGLPPA